MSRLSQDVSRPSIHVSNVRSVEGRDVFLADDLLEIRIRGLAPSCAFSLKCRLEDDKKRAFASEIEYEADETGAWTSTKDFSHRPMESFELCRPAEGQRQGTRLSQSDVMQPQKAFLSVCIDGRSVASTVCERYYHDDANVWREPFRNADGLVGTLFLQRNSTPQNQGRSPSGTSATPADKQAVARSRSNLLILDMFGTGGGLVEYKASLLAARLGCDAVHIGLFNVPGTQLPSVWQDIDLLYLKRFLQAMRLRFPDPEKRFVLHGMSMGGQLGIAAASLFPDLVDGLVSVNGSPFLFDPFRLDGHPLPHYALQTENAEFGTIGEGPDASNFIITERMFKGVDLDIATRKRRDTWPMAPVSSIRCPTLIVASKDDKNWPSLEFAKQVRRITSADPETSINFLELQNAGHLMEPRHGPVCTVVYHGVLKMLLQQGGENLVGAAADFELAYEATLAFCRNIATSAQRARKGAKARL
uniref:Uncharacterized protein n=1 Tax=Chromera velia CCMP2878 TaxID=1169474 RepID=A0A0G4GQ12_9ALVE|eukprot:Cvel_5030.t1-p1 / transcript=Cvel_5030.t1 / gene=Cvel_5030 / organism=Chromera_velia_CCMP2878 / gene_product=Acyl-coenzyme A thioesterase 1, putative / transcript_product=Acyl-coenzyme A thioesterase 1, putative / location=Cvel_scaffold229:9293-10711(+) / protein_length=473 / sequence_SO=supercontig / SO=protein_coding / is_pseudo=false